MPQLSQDPEALAEFFGLLVECPLHGGNPKDCQLRHIRTLHLQDRYEWAKGLQVDEAMKLRVQCGECMARQQQAWRSVAGGKPAD